jgi:alkylation response protein AidB-like acyl-CoA dehydrogenase
MSEPIFQSLKEILPAIEDRATGLDCTGDWPQQDLEDLGRVGAWRWFVPPACGGEGIDPLELHLRYEAIASASLATALVLSQRDSAVGLIDASDAWPMRREFLAGMARGECFATIGIAQLTTSRQGGAPALRALEAEGGYRLEGIIPWCTGAAKAQLVIAGAVLEDERQILFALPTDLPGVRIRAPMPLVSLRSSWTAQIDCLGAGLPQSWVMRPPAAKALAGRSKGIVISQAFLAFGLCRGGLNLIAKHDSDRARSLAKRFLDQLETLRVETIQLCRPGLETEAVAAAPRLRGACNDLAVRITQSAVALYKGSALLSDHPAQRLAREAMFLLVWSCPDSVIDCTVNALAEK